MKYMGVLVMHQSNYGQYEVPAKLLDLITLTGRLKEQGLILYGDLLGIYFSLEPVEMRYLNTPVDVIPFGRTGADGIHFGFLTDFGQVETLDDAYIVRVEPMNFDDPVKIVARNLTDFISIMCQYVFALELLDVSSNVMAITKYLDSTNFVSEQNEMLAICREKLKPVCIESLVDYYVQLRKSRAASVVVQTDDGIGVIKTGQNEIEQQEMFTLKRNMQPDVTAVQHYFKKVPLEYKLAFVRDAQSYGILYEELLLKKWIAEELHRLGFHDEGVRLQFS